MRSYRIKRQEIDPTAFKPTEDKQTLRTTISFGWGRTWSRFSSQITMDRIAQLLLAGSLALGGYFLVTGRNYMEQMEGAVFAAAASSAVCFAWALGCAAKRQYSKAAHRLAAAAAFGGIAVGVRQLKSTSTCRQDPYKTVQATVHQFQFENFNNKSETLIIKPIDGTPREVSLLNVLGNGGSKRALEISGNQALMIPNLDIDPHLEPMKEIESRWVRIVDEEVEESRHRREELGLLSLPLEKVQMCFKKCCSYIPAYITSTFSALGKTAGWSVIDSKNHDSSVKYEKFFENNEERMRPENWDNIIHPLAKDIENLIRHGLPIHGDSVNLVVVKDEKSNLRSVRILGFDYTRKYGPITPPSERAYNTTRSCSSDLASVKDKAVIALEDLVSTITAHEFDIDWYTLKNYREFWATAEELAKKIADRFRGSFFEPC